MKAKITFLMVGTLVLVPPHGLAAPGVVRRFVVAGPGAPDDREQRRWDLRLRRWLEDRHVATEAEPRAVDLAVAAPWRELATASGEPWEKLGTATAKTRAVQRAWDRFRAGRRSEARAILDAARARGPMEPLPSPWDWSDEAAFSPAGDAFAALLGTEGLARCTASSEAQWIDGAPVTAARGLAPGLHGTASVRDGQWRFAAVRCLRDGRVVAVPVAPETVPFLPVSDAWPAVVSLWNAAGVEVLWLGDAPIALTGGTLETAVALDPGGGPLTALAWPASLATLRQKTPVSDRDAAPPDGSAPPSGGNGTTPWLWVALGALAVAAGAVALSVRENARQGAPVSVKWD